MIEWVVFVPDEGLSRYRRSLRADFNLVVQLIMGVALGTGAILAKQKRYRAHGICQTTVLLLNFIDDRTVDGAVVPATGEASPV